MTQRIASHFQTLLPLYNELDVAFLGVGVCIETLAHAFVDRTECMTQRKKKIYSHLIVACKSLQISPVIARMKPLSKTMSKIIAALSIGGVFAVSHAFPRTKGNQWYHQVICNIDYTMDVVAKVVNIISVGVLLRQYSQTAMIVGSIVMTLLSIKTIIDNCRQLSYLRGDKVQ